MVAHFEWPDIAIKTPVKNSCGVRFGSVDQENNGPPLFVTSLADHTVRQWDVIERTFSYSRRVLSKIANGQEPKKA
jgi:hypothetical protein